MSAKEARPRPVQECLGPGFKAPVSMLKQRLRLLEGTQPSIGRVVIGSANSLHLAQPAARNRITCTRYRR